MDGNEAQCSDVRDMRFGVPGLARSGKLAVKQVTHKEGTQAKGRDFHAA